MDKGETEWSRRLAARPFKSRHFSSLQIEHVKQRINQAELRKSWIVRYRLLLSISTLIVILIGALLISAHFHKTELKNVIPPADPPLQLIQNYAYQISVPKAWAVSQLPGAALSFQQNGQELGWSGSSPYDPDQPLSALFPNHSEVLEQEKLSGFFTEVWKVRLSLSQPAASGNTSTAEQVYYFYIINASKTVYELYFNTAAVNDRTALNAARSLKLTDTVQPQPIYYTADQLHNIMNESAKVGLAEPQIPTLTAGDTYLNVVRATADAVILEYHNLMSVTLSAKPFAPIDQTSFNSKKVQLANGAEGEWINGNDYRPVNRSFRFIEQGLYIGLNDHFALKEEQVQDIAVSFRPVTDLLAKAGSE